MIATRRSYLTGMRSTGRARLGIHLVGDKSLERADIDRLVESSPIAGILAPMVADAPADAGKRIVFFDHAQRIVIASLADERNVTLRALAGGAGVAAGSDAFLFNRIGVGNGLRVKLEGGALLNHPLVKTARDDDGTDLRALAAAGAFGNVNVARFVSQRGGEIARLAFHLDDLRIGADFDVEVAAHVHELGAEVAHGAVIRGKGLVELGHVPADGRFGFDQVNLKAGFGEIERGLHPRDAAPHDHDGPGGFRLTWLRFVHPSASLDEDKETG